MPSIKHGTVTGYTTHRCRCQDCLLAMRVCLREHRARRFAARQLIGGRLIAVDVEEHGTNTAYANAGCRCVSCTVAHREYLRSWRRRVRGEGA
jgi:hypothetical protein